MKIDELDLEIIKYLQADARMSFRDIGKNLGVPHTTVFTRADSQQSCTRTNSDCK
jgi:DNA-binding Lrp family transcriptional regulator